MQTKLLSQLSPYLSSCPAYEPRGNAGIVMVHAAAGRENQVTPQGDLPNLDIPNKAEHTNGGGFSGSVSVEIPYGIDERTQESVPLSAICTIYMIITYILLITNSQ